MKRLGRALVSVSVMISVPSACVSFGADDASEAPERSGPDAAREEAATEAGPLVVGPMGDGSPVQDSAKADAAPKCNSVAQLGKKLDVVMHPGVQEAPMGGTLVPGTYVATAAEVRNATAVEGDTFPFGAATLVVTASTIALVMTTDANGELRVTESYTAAGTELAVTSTCISKGSTSTFKQGYTATPTSIALFSRVSTENDGKVIYTMK